MARNEADGVIIEELSWILPYGPAATAYFLKPVGATGRLPAVLALHDHGGNKYFGKDKISDNGSPVHPHVRNTRNQYYSGKAWANELAKRGYAVLVNDAFLFGSRKMAASEIPGLVAQRTMQNPEALRELEPEDMVADSACTKYDVSAAETIPEIERYNAFAAQYESTIAKALLCAGLSWPGIVLAEDTAALDYLASREDVDPGRIGCGGLSGGGLRTNFLAGLDSRIHCSVTTGFMTTWADFARHTAYTHTWMAYVAGLPRFMDYPEILAMRAPRPSLVQSCLQDPLYTPGEVKKAEVILEEIYDKAGAPDCFRMSYYGGPHQFSIPMQEEAFAWFDRWLNK